MAAGSSTVVGGSGAALGLLSPLKRDSSRRSGESPVEPTTSSSGRISSRAVRTAVIGGDGSVVGAGGDEESRSAHVNVADAEEAKESLRTLAVASRRFSVALAALDSQSRPTCGSSSFTSRGRPAAGQPSTASVALAAGLRRVAAATSSSASQRSATEQRSERHGSPADPGELSPREDSGVLWEDDESDWLLSSHDSEDSDGSDE